MVARRAKGYGMSVIYTKRTKDPESEKELGIEAVPLKPDPAPENVSWLGKLMTIV